VLGLGLDADCGFWRFRGIHERCPWRFRLFALHAASCLTQDLDINLNISGAGSPLSPLSLQGTRPSTPDAKGRKTSSGRTGLMQSLAHAERSLADRREPAVPDALASVAASSTTGVCGCWPWSRNEEVYGRPPAAVCCGEERGIETDTRIIHPCSPWPVPPVAGDATATTAAAPSLGPKSQTASAGGVQAGVSRQNSAPGMVVPKSSIFGYDDDDLAGTKHTIRLRRGSTPKAVRQPRKGGAGMFLE
jgi:hypothetical protein